MSDELRKIRQRIDGAVDVISWGNEEGWHDHEVAKSLPDGDVDYYDWTHPDQQKQR